MSMITWDDQRATGVPPIDDNHQRVIAFINHLDELRAADHRALIDGATLEALVAFARHQLGREEEMLHVTGFPDLETHQQDHRRAQRFLHELQNDHLDGRPVRCTTVLNFLTFWLSEHILGRDMPAADHLRQGTGVLAP